MAKKHKQQQHHQKQANLREFVANRAHLPTSAGRRTGPAPGPHANAPSLHMAATILSFEDQQEFDRVRAALLPDFNPQSVPETVIFDKIVLTLWDHHLYSQMNTARLELAINDPALTAGFTHLQGYARASRAFSSLNAESPATTNALDRKLAHLDRLFLRLFNQYIQLHGPLGTPQKPRSQNEPILEEHN